MIPRVLVVILVGNEKCAEALFSVTLLNVIDNAASIGFLQRHDCAVLTDPGCALGEDHFWGALAEDTDCSIVESHHVGCSLALRAERNLGDGLVSVTLFDLFFYVAARLVEILDEADFGNVALVIVLTVFAWLDECGAIKYNGLLDLVRAWNLIDSVVDIAVHYGTFSVERHDCHLVLSECACLVSADLICISHGL